MAELLSVLVSFPTVIFTGLLGLVLVYWLFVILGALDIDLFHADADAALDGAADGAIDGVAGAAKGAFEGVAAAKGAFEAAGKVGAEAAADAIGGHDGIDLDGAEAGKAEAAAGLLAALNLRRAPVTVTFSLIVFFSWVMSYFAVTYLGPIATVALPGWLFGTITFFGVLGLSLPITSLATKPMEKVFKTTEGQKRIDIVGSVCRIRTGNVDDAFGQAEVDDGGAGLIIQVRADGGKLKRGDHALIIDFDREKEAYIVEAYDAMLERERDRHG